MSYYSGCDCGSGGYFVGASRTYVYYAKEFDDWCKKLAVGDDYISRDGKKCVSARAEYNVCDERVGADGYDYAYTYYYHYLISKRFGYCVTLLPDYIPCTTNLWQGVVEWSESTAESVNGITNVNCYPTPSQSEKCGGIGTYKMVRDFTSGIEEYYANINPYPWSGYVYDFFGMVGQGPSAVPPGGAFNAYCGVGTSTTTIDPVFSWRGFESKVFLFNKQKGIPHARTEKFEEFYEKNQYTITNIEADHLADETIQVTGTSNWNDGNITYKGTALYADYMGDNATFEFDRLASFTEGSGKSTYYINNVAFRDTATKNKNCTNYPEFKDYPWIMADIPMPTTIENADNVQYTSVFITPSESTISKFLNSSQDLNFHGIGWVIPVLTDAIYYKRYTKKIIKAPHNLYVKEGELNFRRCGWGETLKDLEPGRYYFPNMCYGCLAPKTLSFYDPFKATQDYPISDRDMAAFFDALPTQFSGSFQEAEKILGYPSASIAIPIEGPSGSLNTFMSKEESIAFLLGIIDRNT